MSTTADIKTEGILDYLDYFRKFSEFRQRFTDEDGITFKDVLDAGTALAEILSFGPEGKELRDVIEAIKRKDSLSRTLDEVIEFLTILNKRIAAFTKEQDGTSSPDDLQTIPITTGVAPAGTFAEICGQIADTLAPVRPADQGATLTGQPATGVSAAPPTNLHPILIGLAIQGLIKFGEYVIRRFQEKRSAPVT